MFFICVKISSPFLFFSFLQIKKINTKFFNFSFDIIFSLNPNINDFAIIYIISKIIINIIKYFLYENNFKFLINKVEYIK